MVTTYRYRAIRKSDGVEIHQGTIAAVLDRGLGATAGTFCARLIDSHESARDLQHEAIDIEMSVALGGLEAMKKRLGFLRAQFILLHQCKLFVRTARAFFIPTRRSVQKHLAAP